MAFEVINERYSRQILFSDIGREGQERLWRSHVLIVGCGALRASHAEMLARAGVGRVTIVDRDFVEMTNLQRQTLYKESDAAERLPKAIAAKNRLAEINSEIELEAVVADVNNSNIESLVRGKTLVLDGSDNFQVRYLVNDACVKLGVPWIYGAAVSSYGTTMTIIPGETPCLECVFEEMPDPGSAPTCDTAGVIMPIISTVSAMQVAEALKLLTGNTDALSRSLVQMDVWSNERHAIKVGEPREDCRACGRRDFKYLEAESNEFAAVLCGRDAVQVSPALGSHVDLVRLAERLAAFTDVKANEYLARFRADGREFTVFADGRAIIKGADDVAAARSLYARYVGS